MQNVLRDKSYNFALRIIKLNRYLALEKQEYVISKQIFRSGTAIGALVWEAEYGESKKDFIHKMSVALKEANETEYWLLLLKDSDYIEDIMYQSIYPEITELLKLLVSSIKTAKKSLKLKWDIPWAMQLFIIHCSFFIKHFKKINRILNETNLFSHPSCTYITIFLPAWMDKAGAEIWLWKIG